MVRYVSARSSQKSVVLTLLLCLTVAAVLLLYFDSILLGAFQRLDFLRILERVSSTDSLNSIAQIYVLSLPDRQSRREDMEKLRRSLGLYWTYVEALPAVSPLVMNLMNWVAFVRSHYSTSTHGHPISSYPDMGTLSFAWPSDIDALATSSEGLDLWSPDFELARTPVGNSSHPPGQTLTCATEDFKINPLSAALPEHLILTPARIACWHSHLSVIHQIANGRKSDLSGAALILEDDVDMEKDIAKQLRKLWPLLPDGWDIVFLGHCWSDERRGRPLTQNLSVGTPSDPWLYVSSSPKCTHAYALSRIGARRLLLHLRYPPFAYSRAIDQALSWLVESGRLSSFSVVPSLIVQRKIEKSDVMPGVGSKWKDRLVNGIFN